MGRARRCSWPSGHHCLLRCYSRTGRAWEFHRRWEVDCGWAPQQSRTGVIHTEVGLRCRCPTMACVPLSSPIKRTDSPRGLQWKPVFALPLPSLCRVHRLSLYLFRGHARSSSLGAHSPVKGAQAESPGSVCEQGRLSLECRQEGRAAWGDPW